MYTEMIVDYSAEIKIAIFQSVWNANVTNEDRRKIVGESRQKLCVLIALTPRLLDGINQIWTRCSLIIAIKFFESGFTIGQSVVECQSK